MQNQDGVAQLRLESVTKRFPGVIACNGVTLELGRNQVLALVGENGAGKTTLMNILMGLYQPDEGRILVDNKEVKFRTPLDAHDQGIGMVHQHFMLVPNLTVTENVMLGLRKMHKFGRLNQRETTRLIGEVAERYGLPVQADAHIWQLSVGEQQRVELVKTLCLGARILILDEPTSALTPQETDDLLSLLQRMKQELSVIFISHKLNEVQQIADQVAVLRHGQLVCQSPVSQYGVHELAELMTGHEVVLPRNETAAPAGTTSALNLWNVAVRGDRGNLAVNHFDLKLFAGEIVGLAGVSGNGQRELADALAGLRKVEEGGIHLGERRIDGLTPRQIIESGMGYIPEDRHNEGIVPSFSIRENLILKDFAGRQFSRLGFLRLGETERNARELKSQFDIRAASTALAAGTLSGGNIQKVILARELLRRPSVLVAVYPTRGLDLGAIEFIHRRLLDLRNQGVAILLISEELDELMNLSDRIAVIYKGSVARIMPAREATRRELGILMAGVQDKGGAE